MKHNADTVFDRVAAHYNISTEEARAEIQFAIDLAWLNPDGRREQLRLFPEGKPTPEEFVRRMAAEVLILDTPQI